MKKFFIGTALVVMFFSHGKMVSANIPTIDGSAIAQAAAQVGKLVDILKTTTGIDISSYLTQINTYKTMYHETIQVPLQNAMNAITIQNSADQIINMVNGSVNGNSLLVANPEKFVKKAELNSVQASYNLVASADGAYSADIMRAISIATRQEDPKATLSALTHSEIPTAIQGSVCEDGALTDMAIYNVSENGNVEYTDAQVAAEKSSLYNAVCIGDPNNDPAIAQRLLALNDQVPSVGGWDTWLRKTGGDNPFSRTQRAIPIVKKDAETKAYFAEKKLDWGDGIASEETCVEKDSEGLCIETAVINPGSVLRDAYSQAKNIGLETAINAFGTGVDGGGLFGDLSDILGFVGDAYQAVNGASSFINSIGGLADSADIDAQINSARNPTNVSVVASASFTSDLATATATKEQILGLIMPTLNGHIAILDDAITVDTAYIAEVTAYKNLLNGVPACFQGVEASAFQRGQSYTRPASVTSFYNQENQTTTNLLTTLTTERSSGIPSTKNYLQNTITRMNNSNSSEEINYYANDYKNKVDSGQLLGPLLNTTRAGELSTYRANLSAKQEAITSKMTECATAQASLGG